MSRSSPLRAMMLKRSSVQYTPEMESETLSRSRAECRMSGESRILLRVGASDPSALRAALNMWLRLVNVAFEMKELIKQEGS